jgi:DnaJ-class molecular chaperone
MCPYEILGLQRSKRPSEEEVRSQYKKLALIYHPDKNKNPTAPADFARIHEAYLQLTGSPFSPSPSPPHSSSDTDALFVREMLPELFRWIMQRINQQTLLYFYLLSTLHQPPKDIDIVLEVSLKDVLEARVKKLTMQVKRFPQDNSNPEKEKEKEKETLFVPLGRWSPIEDTYVFKERGDEGFRTRTRTRSDICIRVKVTDLCPSIYFDDLLQDRSISTHIRVSLYDFYYSNSITVDLTTNGSVKKVIENKQKHSYCVEGAGLPRGSGLANGDLYVYIEVDLPKAIDRSDPLLKKAIKTHFSSICSSEAT